MATCDCRADLNWVLPLLVAVFLSSGELFAAYTANGRFLYEDREFDLRGFTGKVTVRPIRFADIRIMAGNELVAKGATNADGTYSILVPSQKTQDITAVCVASATATPGLLLDVRVANDDYTFGDYYSVASARMIASGTGVVEFGSVLATKDSDPGRVFNIWDVAIDAMQFIASPEIAGRFPGQRLTMLWRLTHDGSSSFFSAESSGTSFVFVDAYAACDDTVISHEIGHFIDFVYSQSDSPGGTHYLGDDSQDMRLSWAEGLATYLGSSIRKFKGYPRPDLYVNTDGVRLSFSYEIESLTGVSMASKTGSTNEVAVTAALWDITDGPGTADGTPGTDDDPLERPFADVWAVLAGYFPSVTRPGITAETFWDGWFSPAVNNGFASEMQTTFAAINGMEFMPDGLESDNQPRGAPSVPLAQLPAPPSGAAVVINEVDLGNVDGIELHNSGGAAADLAGWAVEASTPGYSTVVFEIPALRLEPGSVVVLSEAAGTNTKFTLYFGQNIPWSNGSDGACTLRDERGTARDFVRWGSSTERVPAGTAFAGTNPASPAAGKTLGRNLAGFDSDNAADWTAQPGTIGTLNYSGQERHHTFYPAADVDYGTFFATAGRTYLLETMNLSNGADTVAEILTGDGVSVLAGNDDSGTGKASRLAWTAPSTGTYLARIRRFDGTTNLARYGSYDLRVIEGKSAFMVAMPALLTVSRESQGGKYGTLSEAISAATTGDSIEVLDSGTYRENITISGKSVTIRAANGRHPTIDGNLRPLYPTLVISNAKAVRLEGLIITGGAIGIWIDSGNLTVVNSVLTAAVDPTYGDGVEAVGAATTAKIIHCTILNNPRLGVGAFRSADVTVVNSILGNYRDIGGDGSARNLSVRNCLLSGGSFVGTNGNITGTPQFADSVDGNFRLTAGSPAIDEGDPSDPDLPTTDADGIPRAVDGRKSGRAVPDLGAYEYLPPGTLPAITVLPQVAAGGSSPVYVTQIYGINTGGVPALATLSLTSSDGKPLPVRLQQDGVARPSEAPANSCNMSVPPLGIASFAATAGSRTTAGYAVFSSSVPLGGSALLKTISGSAVLSEAGVGFSRPTKAFTVYVSDLDAAVSGYAVANFGPAPASLILKLRDAEGNIRDTKTVLLGAGQHIAEFAFQRFPVAIDGRFEGTIEFASDQDIAALALRYDNPGGDVFSTIPVLVDEASTTLLFSHLADGAGYRTEFVFINPSDVEAEGALEFLGDDGKPLTLTVGRQTVSRTSFALPARGVIRLVTDGTSTDLKTGWARLTANTAVGGSALFQAVSGSRVVSEAGVSSSPPAVHLMNYVEATGYTRTGVALCNPNQSVTTVTLNVRDSAGMVLDTARFELPPFAHVARFLSDWIPAARGFVGTIEIVATGGVAGISVRYDNADAGVFATQPMTVIP
jgi:hypothetical protein